MPPTKLSPIREEAFFGYSKSFLYCKYNILASVSKSSSVQTGYPIPVPLVDPVFLDSVNQTLHPYLDVEYIHSTIGTCWISLNSMNHLKPMLCPNVDGPWRVNYCEVMLVLKSLGIPSRYAYGSVQPCESLDVWSKSIVETLSLKTRLHRPLDGEKFVTFFIGNGDDSSGLMTFDNLLTSEAEAQLVSLGTPGSKPDELMGRYEKSSRQFGFRLGGWGLWHGRSSGVLGWFQPTVIGCLKFYSLVGWEAAVMGLIDEPRWSVGDGGGEDRTGRLGVEEEEDDGAKVKTVGCVIYVHIDFSRASYKHQCDLLEFWWELDSHIRSVKKYFHISFLEDLLMSAPRVLDSMFVGNAGSHPQIRDIFVLVVVVLVLTLAHTRMSGGKNGGTDTDRSPGVLGPAWPSSGCTLLTARGIPHLIPFCCASCSVKPSSAYRDDELVMTEENPEQLGSARLSLFLFLNSRSSVCKLSSISSPELHSHQTQVQSMEYTHQKISHRPAAEISMGSLLPNSPALARAAVFSLLGYLGFGGFCDKLRCNLLLEWSSSDEGDSGLDGIVLALLGVYNQFSEPNTWDHSVAFSFPWTRLMIAKNLQHWAIGLQSQKVFLVSNSIPETVELDSGIVEVGFKRSEEVGMFQNVHHNLVDWVALRLFSIQIAIDFPYWHPMNASHIHRKTCIQIGDVRCVQASNSLNVTTILVKINS
ncbi:hypothetical protein Tco_1515278 [Tanacetum coccineum]